jgi:hypothetical protein
MILPVINITKQGLIKITGEHVRLIEITGERVTFHEINLNNYSNLVVFCVLTSKIKL